MGDMHLPSVGEVKLSGRLEFISDYYQQMVGAVITAVSSREIKGRTYPVMELRLSNGDEAALMVVDRKNPLLPSGVIITDGDDLDDADEFIGSVIVDTYMAAPKNSGVESMADQFPAMQIKTTSGKRTVVAFGDEKPGLLVGLPIPRLH